VRYAQATLAWLRLVEKATGQSLSWALLVVVLLQVLDRFAFGGHLQLAWTEEIARIALVWYAFWGAILVQDERSHIRLEFLEEALSDHWRRILTVVIQVVVGLFLLVIVASAYGYTWHEMDFRLPATGLPRSIFVLAVLASSALMLAHMVLEMVLRAGMGSDPDRADG